MREKSNQNLWDTFVTIAELITNIAKRFVSQIFGLIWSFSYIQSTQKKSVYKNRYTGSIIYDVA